MKFNNIRIFSSIKLLILSLGNYQSSNNNVAPMTNKYTKYILSVVKLYQQHVTFSRCNTKAEYKIIILTMCNVPQSRTNSNEMIDY